MNDDISLDELEEKLRSAEDLREMYEPLKECLEAIDLPQIVLGLVENKPINEDTRPASLLRQLF